MTTERQKQRAQGSYPLDARFKDRLGRTCNASREETPFVKGRHVQRVGTAYAFFSYGGSQKDIVASLPPIRDTLQIPENLELTVMGGKEGFIDDPAYKARVEIDPALRDVGERASRAGINYVIEAVHPASSSRQTALELGDVMNGVYYSLFEASAPFSGEIVYPNKQGTKYLFRRT